MGEVKEAIVGIGNFGGGNKKGQGQGLLRSYKGLKQAGTEISYEEWICLLRSYKGLKPFQDPRCS
mgnify:CR=1 FL=1